MKIDRDSFFGQYGAYGYNSVPNQNMPQMMPQNDLNERLNKIEREIASINQRINKLESASVSTTTNDFNFTNSMYMV